jgi:hypothetical protein
LVDSQDATAYAQLMEARAAAGDLQGIIFLRNEGLSWTEKMCSQASAGGHLEVLCWMRLQTPPCPWGSAAACAIAAAGECRSSYQPAFASVYMLVITLHMKQLLLFAMSSSKLSHSCHSQYGSRREAF